MNIQVEEMRRARYVERGGASVPSRGHRSPHTSTCSLTRKLSEPQTPGIVTGVSPLRHDRSLTPFLAPLPSVEERGGAENSKLLIMAWPFW